MSSKVSRDEAPAKGPPLPGQIVDVHAGKAPGRPEQHGVADAGEQSMARDRFHFQELSESPQGPARATFLNHDEVGLLAAQCVNGPFHTCAERLDVVAGHEQTHGRRLLQMIACSGLQDRMERVGDRRRTFGLLKFVVDADGRLVDVDQPAKIDRSGDHHNICRS